LKYFLPVLLFFSYSVNAQKISVLFNSGEAILSQKDKKSLDSLMLTFETELVYHIKLVGHTDSIGSLKGNQLLSEKRALVVRQYLSKKKNIKSFEIVGKAYLSPAKANVTEEGRTQNRRCEIVVTSMMTEQELWEVPVQSFAIKNNTKNILYTKNGCKVIIEPGSFRVNENDKVNIRITEYNDPVDYLVGGLPMSYTSSGRTYMYQSEQMMKITAYIDSIPVQLQKLIGLQCPFIDTTGDVRFYEFRGVENKSMNVREKFIQGRVEEIEVEIENNELKSNLKTHEPDTAKLISYNEEVIDVTAETDKTKKASQERGKVKILVVRNLN